MLEFAVSEFCLIVWSCLTHKLLKRLSLAGVSHGIHDVKVGGLDTLFNLLVPLLTHKGKTMNVATVSKDDCCEFGNGLNFHVKPKLRGLLPFVVLFATLGSTTASAYQFGPPPITELAEAGKTQTRFSVYKQTTTPETGTFKPTLLGINIASSTGDTTGSRTGMFRLAKYSDNASTAWGAPSSGSGFLIGGGFGGQWNFGESRNYGLLLDGQADLLSYKYTETWTSVQATQLALGVEAGAFYRFFIDVATITPFVTVMKGKSRRTYVLDYPYADQIVSYDDKGRTIGVDFNMGKFAATILRTNSPIAYKTQWASGTYQTTITMLVLGINY